MRSFGLIEKYECPHHRVLTQETPPRTNDEILLSSKKLYENHFHTILAHCVGAVPAQPNTALFPPLWVSIHKAQLGTAQLFYGILLDGGKQQ